jgi:ATP-dependent Clp protease ATP-binding subunit ClpA
MFERFTDKARAAVFQARATAAGRGDRMIRPAYLLYALAAGDGVAARALAGLGVEAAGLERQLDRAAPLGNPLAGEADSADAEALAAIGVDLDEIRRKVEEGFGPGALGRMAPPPPRRPGRLAVTGELKQALALALSEARALHHDYIGTEHLLLGLLAMAGRTPRGDFTPETLRDFGINPDLARQRVLDELRRATA